MSTVADKFYGSSRRPLGLVNRVGEGNRQKKRRTEDLDLSAVIRRISLCTDIAHEKKNYGFTPDLDFNPVFTKFNFTEFLHTKPTPAAHQEERELVSMVSV